MARIADVLERAGLAVSETEFARLVETALAQLGPEPVDDPRDGLTEDEAAALEAVGADLQPRRRREADPRAGSAAAVAAVLADALPVAEVARRLGVDASRIRHRLADRTLLGIRRTDGWRLPRWQFGADGLPLPGLPALLRALPGDVHPLVVAQFFATPQPELVVGRKAVSPREWLAGGGDPAPAVALAQALSVVA